jgi:fructokinase
MAKITCFGEVLFDLFPTGKKLGGAPLNVAYRLNALGNEVQMISKIGLDTNGTELLNDLKQNQLDTSLIQTDDTLNTSVVQVTLNDKGSASYEIVYPCAWDRINLTKEALNTVAKADAFVFGSLVARDPVSKETLLALLEAANYRIFDVNLRKPFYHIDVLYQGMQKANFIKCNDEELYEICALLGSKFHSLEQNITFLAQQTNTSAICVTKGEYGAVLLYKDAWYYNSGFKIKVKDTVGAGDSFLATLIDGLLNGTEPQQAINRACAVGALVAGSDGANPTISNEVIATFINPS